MTAHDRADAHEAALLRWLVAQRLWFAPHVVAIRDPQGQVIVELPAKDGREIEDLLIDMLDDVTDD